MRNLGYEDRRMSDRYQPWRRRLAAIAQAGQTRTLRCLTPTSATTALLDDTPMIVACSNDYLGLGWELRAVTGSGATGSRLISGDRPEHHALEDALEEHFGRPALVFTSGYHANLAVFSTVVGEGDIVASDALNHASIIDGLRLGRASRRVIPHDSACEEATLTVVEGLFSMDGDRPTLTQHAENTLLAVDEAHSIGALGPDGRGVAAAQGVLPDILIGTFGKAYGAAGAFVVGPPELKALLLNAGRSFIFTTGLHTAAARAALLGLKMADSARREKLALNVRVFRAGLRQLGWSPLGEDHIVPVVVGPRVMEHSQRLIERGIYAPGIRWPTVARGAERIRFTLSAAHTPQQLTRILDALGPR